MEQELIKGSSFVFRARFLKLCIEISDDNSDQVISSVEMRRTVELVKVAIVWRSFYQLIAQSLW